MSLSPNDGPLRPGQYFGREIFEIKPVILGGDPTDPQNKVALTRNQHIETVRYWNRIIKGIRDKED